MQTPETFTHSNTHAYTQKFNENQHNIELPTPTKLLSPVLLLSLLQCLSSLSLSYLFPVSFFFLSQLLNSSDTNTNISVRTSVFSQLASLGNVDAYSEHFFVDEDIQIAIAKLKKVTSISPDSLSSEHVIYAQPRIHRLLCIVFNCMLVHGFLPDALMNTTLVSLLKDKKGDITDKDNYRPIAITTPFSKVLELAISLW
jgi:hypothetical protein